MKKVVKNQGFTLIELIVYIALVSIFITGAISFSIDVVQARQKAKIQMQVEQESRSTMARIAYEIRRAESINSVTNSQIILNNSGSTTTVNLNSNVIYLTTGGVGPLALTSNQVRVTGLLFTNNSSLDNNSNNINISLTVEQFTTGVSQTYQATTTQTSTVELHPDFSSARDILIDATNLVLSNGDKRVNDINLENTGAANITIDKITATWGSAELIRRIKIAGNTVWDRNGPGTPSGMQPSGTTLDIVNTVIPSASSLLLDEVRFDGSVGGTNLSLLLTMLDGSTRTMIITNLSSSGGGGGGGGGGTEAGNLVVNTASVSLKPNKYKEVLGITIENIGAADITIASMTLTWTNGRLVQRVQVDGTRIWDRKGPGTPTGRQPSGTVLDVVDFVIPAGAGVLPINTIKFNGSMVGDTLNITFTMLDGSTLVVSGIVL